MGRGHAGKTTRGAGTYAAASSVGVSALGLGSGSTSAASCDTDGVSVTYTTGTDATAGYTVTQATVSGIASACAGLPVNVRLTDSATSSKGSGGPVTVGAGGGSVNVPISGTVGVTSISNVHVEIG